MLWMTCLRRASTASSCEVSHGLLSFDVSSEARAYEALRLSIHPFPLQGAQPAQ